MVDHVCKISLEDLSAFVKAESNYKFPDHFLIKGYGTNLSEVSLFFQSHFKDCNSCFDTYSFLKKTRSSIEFEMLDFKKFTSTKEGVKKVITSIFTDPVKDFLNKHSDDALAYLDYIYNRLKGIYLPDNDKEKHIKNCSNCDIISQRLNSGSNLESTLYDITTELFESTHPDREKLNNFILMKYVFPKISTINTEILDLYFPSLKNHPSLSPSSNYESHIKDCSYCKAYITSIGFIISK